MCSRGLILLEIHDAIAMVTQNWLGKNMMCSQGRPRDLSLFSDGNPVKEDNPKNQTTPKLGQAKK